MTAAAGDASACKPDECSPESTLSITDEPVAGACDIDGVVGTVVRLVLVPRRMGAAPFAATGEEPDDATPPAPFGAAFATPTAVVAAGRVTCTLPSDTEGAAGPGNSRRSA